MSDEEKLIMMYAAVEGQAGVDYWASVESIEDEYGAAAGLVFFELDEHQRRREAQRISREQIMFDFVTKDF